MPRFRASAPPCSSPTGGKAEPTKSGPGASRPAWVGDGVKVTLDQWHAVPGDQLPEFMERVIRRSRHVLIICTPRYKKRADKRLGGVGYEGDIMTAEVFEKKSPQRQRKFIPILRAGSLGAVGPLPGFGASIAFTSTATRIAEEQYQDLLATLHNARPKPPALGLGRRSIGLKKSASTSNLRMLMNDSSPSLPYRKSARRLVPALATALKDDAVGVRNSAAATLGQSARRLRRPSRLSPRP